MDRGRLPAQSPLLKSRHHLNGHAGTLEKSNHIRYTVTRRGGWLLIQSFRDRWLRDFYLDDKSSKKIPAEIVDRLFRKLQLVDDATSDLDLRSPPSNHFEKLRGNLSGKHSIRINKQWRLVFTWSGERGEAQEIYLDNHDYR
jgi:proteic killer suppression protein